MIAIRQADKVMKRWVNERDNLSTFLTQGAKWMEAARQQVI
jgi:hypothetical protein